MSARIEMIESPVNRRNNVTFCQLIPSRETPSKGYFVRVNWSNWQSMAEPDDLIWVNLCLYAS